MTIVSAQAQTWTPLVNTPNISAYNPTLLADGRVMVQDGDNSDWYMLTPTSKGSYANGTWKKLASTPGYGPLYYASALLPDGRVFTMGGEYNFGDNDWQNQGFIYNPDTDTWAAVNAPSSWGNMGDTGSCMMPNGTLLIADPFSNQCVIFNPATNTMGQPFVNGKSDANDEEGLCLLPNGNILTVDAVTSLNSEIFNTKTLTWSTGGSTINTLVGQGEEIGPMVLRPDGTVICFGGGGNNSIYNTKTSTWSAGPKFPSVGAGQLDCADAPACLLPSGNVLVETSPGLFLSGVQFFEWDGANLNMVANTPSAPNDTSFTGNMLMLPTGQMLYTNQSPSMYLYTSKGTYSQAWAPVITGAPSSVQSGSTYTLAGTQLSGLSQSSAYGDDEQNYTNYPIITLTNNKTGDVAYCKMTNPSTYTVATGTLSETYSFTVPKTAELGPSTLVATTNGIPSKPVAITVGPPAQASGISVYQGRYLSGTLASVFVAGDGNTYDVQSISTAAGQTCSIECDFNITSTTVGTIGVNATGAAKPGVTGQLFLYDFVAKAFVIVVASPLNTGQVQFSGEATTNTSRFVGPNGLVRCIFRALGPARLNAVPFVLSADQIQVSA